MSIKSALALHVIASYMYVPDRQPPLAHSWLPYFSLSHALFKFPHLPASQRADAGRCLQSTPPATPSMSSADLAGSLELRVLELAHFRLRKQPAQIPAPAAPHQAGTSPQAELPLLWLDS